MWQKIRITSAEAVAGRHQALQDAIDRRRSLSGMLVDAALFAGPYDDSGGFYLYLSPSLAAACRALVEENNGKPCARPRRLGLSLAVGDARAWDLFGKDDEGA